MLKEEMRINRSYDGILQMVEMAVDSCKDLDEAKQKIAELRKSKKEIAFQKFMYKMRMAEKSVEEDGYYTKEGVEEELAKI